MKILILCTGNSCRSQMAHGFLQSLDEDIQVFSAGTHPAPNVNPLAVEVMAEIGIDISRHTPTDVNTYLDKTWGLCDNRMQQRTRDLPHLYRQRLETVTHRIR